MIRADLSGKVAFVTGGASGIGLATVERLVANGAKVAINDLAGNPRLASEVARLGAAGHDVASFTGDVSKPDDVTRMIEAAATHFGRLDYLVNNAGTPGTSKPIPVDDFERQDEAFWSKLIAINQVGPYRCLKAAAPHLKKAKGAVVNVCSTAGLGYGGSSSAYGATKAALLRESDFLCFPTYYEAEGQPVNVIEALAFGLPPIVTRWRLWRELKRERKRRALARIEAAR